MNVDDDTDASDGDPVTDNTTTAQIYTAGADNTCAADNAAIEVTFVEVGNLDAALPGTYTDLITLTVSAL